MWGARAESAVKVLRKGARIQVDGHDCVAIFCKTFWDFRVTKRSKNLATSYCLRRPGRPAFDRSRPDKGSEPGSTMARRPVAMPCGWPTTVANATTFGHPPGARASGDYSTRSHSHRSMSRSGCGRNPGRTRRAPSIAHYG
ncbi:hypothetical protein JOD69_001377 [Methylocaldum sp. RMAD-M]|nr:hypothetical protein [Methylocaldum sp. RMAD-M]